MVPTPMTTTPTGADVDMRGKEIPWCDTDSGADNSGGGAIAPRLRDLERLTAKQRGMADGPAWVEAVVARLSGLGWRPDAGQLRCQIDQFLAAGHQFLDAVAGD